MSKAGSTDAAYSAAFLVYDLLSSCLQRQLEVWCLWHLCHGVISFVVILILGNVAAAAGLIDRRGSLTPWSQLMDSPMSDLPLPNGC
jgi:hypothetical protein